MIRYNAINNNFQTIGNMKKNILSAATILAATLAFTACQNSDEMTEDLHKQVNIIASIDGQARSAQSRVQMAEDGSGTFKNGDKIALYTNHSGLSEYILGTTKLYWDEVATSPDATVNFHGWYPHFQPNSFEGSDYNVAGATDNTHRDLLVAGKTSVQVGNAVALAFRHVMHKLEVYLTSNYLTDEQMKKAKVTLSKETFKSHARINLLTAEVKPESASGNAEYPSASGTKTTFIVAPQDLAIEAEMLRIEVGDMTFAYLVPQAPETSGSPTDFYRLQSGKTLKLTLRLNRNGLSLDEMTISAWEAQGELEDEVSEKPTNDDEDDGDEEVDEEDEGEDEGEE